MSRPAAVIVLRHGGQHPPPVDGTAWNEGPLSISVRPGPFLGLHVGTRFVCVLEGALYACPGADTGGLPARGEDAARWLAGAYERVGRGVFGRLRGEYWGMVWDRQRREGVAVCDHIAARSAYWTRCDGALHLASELDELLRSLPRAPQPDPLALAHWLMVTLPPQGRTLYAGVHRLPGAHLLALEPHQSRPRRYWEPVYREPRRVSRDAAVEEVRAALRTAVARRLAVTGEPGRAAVLMSGGLDSSAIAALSAEREPGIATYSALFPSHPEVDESAYIDRTAAALRLPSTRVIVNGGSVIAGADAFLARWRTPPSSPNQFFWIPLLQRAGADGVSVMLDGEGGDEVFGASPLLLADRLRRGDLRGAVRLARYWPGAQAPARRDILLSRLRIYGLRGMMPPAGHQLMRRMRPLPSYAPPWLPADLAAAWLQTELSPFAFKRPGHPRWWSYLVEAITRGSGPSILFEQARRRASFAGLEARHPLMDIDLVELVLGFDPELAFQGPLTRPLLREALAGRLDEAVRLRRAKSFFDAVFHGVLGGTDLPRARSLLDPRRAELGAYIDATALHDQLFGRPAEEFPTGVQGWALVTWRAVTAELWLRQQHGSDPDASSRNTSPLFEVRQRWEK